MENRLTKNRGHFRGAGQTQDDEGPDSPPIDPASPPLDEGTDEGDVADTGSSEGGNGGGEGGSTPGEGGNTPGEGRSGGARAGGSGLSQPLFSPPGGPFDDPPISPLIIDLDGDGVETIALEDSNIFFDLNEDGFAELTGFVAPDDALLALDRNGDGIINSNAELFGSTTEERKSRLLRAAHHVRIIARGIIGSASAATTTISASFT